jgi:hypothetical protein
MSRNNDCIDITIPEEEKSELSWDDIRAKVTDLAKDIYSMQQVNIELSKNNDNPRLNDKIRGLTNTLLDITHELKDIKDKFDIPNKTGMVDLNEEGSVDAMRCIECTNDLLNVEGKLTMLQGSSVIDIVMDMTSDDKLISDSKLLKEEISNNLSTIKEDDAK